jgi:asparagine synthase (glutamine-hydrolysing)
MCGIAGYFQLNEPAPPETEMVARMVAAIRHRGPDEMGICFDERCVLGHARLSIIDLAGGSQPLSNEDGSIWVTYNGEIYNYVELREELLKRGHKFRTNSDTEVIVHAYEEYGRDCLGHFNGQFAFAIYDRRRNKLLLARDRMGIRPAFYTVHNKRFYFASEIKSIFCDSTIPRRLDLRGLDETFTWWTSAPPRTMFEGINELEAGTFVEISDGRIESGRYWQMTYPEHFDYDRPVESYAEELRALLIDSVRLRLRSDVPVGAYLSGGLDSSVTTALIRHFTQAELETFSVTFEDAAFDESSFQQQMAAHLGTDHHTVSCSHRSIAEAFADVIYHAERPLVRTAPTPLMLLSGLVRKNNFKVVLTGEGADEILGGYDIFKETLIRAFWSRQPESTWRPLLLKKLYPTLPVSGARARHYLEQFYKIGLDRIADFHYSHMPRINTTTRIKEFFSADVKNRLADHDAIAAFGCDLPESFDRWHHLSRAQYLESKSLLAGYLLSSQGDRVSAANSVEGRFPFLDHRLVEFAATIPPLYKIFGLNEKYLLKRAMQPEIPAEILQRVKQPYMAPDSNCFVQADSPDYVAEMLSESALEHTALFNPKAVGLLVKKCRRGAGGHLSFRDNMSFVGILSTQLLIKQFIDDFQIPESPDREAFTVWQELAAVG